MIVLLYVLIGLFVAGVYLSWLAGRLDRLHARVDAAWAALDAQLVRRASVAFELASSGLLDPATAVLLAGAAHEARDAKPAVRELSESDLSRALRAAFDEPEELDLLRAEPEGAEYLAELDAAVRRVQLARRFHNEAVRSTRMLRRKRLVRYARLAGRAALPMAFEMDDAPPSGLERTAEG
jgi:hypothetical protein